MRHTSGALRARLAVGVAVEIHGAAGCLSTADWDAVYSVVDERFGEALREAEGEIGHIPTFDEIRASLPTAERVAHHQRIAEERRRAMDVLRAARITLADDERRRGGPARMERVRFDLFVQYVTPEDSRAREILEGVCDVQVKSINKFIEQRLLDLCTGGLFRVVAKDKRTAAARRNSYAA